MLFSVQELWITNVVHIPILRKNEKLGRKNEDKTGVINDPLGQTRSLASSELLLDFEKWGGRTERRTTCAETMIPTGRDFRSAEWINKQLKLIELLSLRAILRYLC